jgi:hypothetical protein
VLYCPRAPLLVYWPLPLPLCLDSPWSSSLPFVCVFPQPSDATELPSPILARSSGFSPPHCYQASQALSPQYYTQICHPLSLSQSGSLPSRAGFMAPPETLGARTGGFPRVRSHRLPISRPTSPRFGSPDIRTRSGTPARPPPRGHPVGSLSATYMGSASCFLQTSISGHALPLLALPFRPVTADSHSFGVCVMPGAREAPRPQGGASRQCNIIYIVPLYPAYPARAGRGTFRSNRTNANETNKSDVGCVP